MARASNKNAKTAAGRGKPDLVANYSPIGITAVAASARYQGERNNRTPSKTRAPSSSVGDDGGAARAGTESRRRR
jgi:hypothetical protein